MELQYVVSVIARTNQHFCDCLEINQSGIGRDADGRTTSCFGVGQKQPSERS
jgi:hypothetical protein